MANVKRRNDKPPLFRVGDRVRFTFGVKPIVGVVVEDRGVILTGGRRVYRVVVDDPEHYFHLDTERAEEALELVN